MKKPERFALGLFKPGLLRTHFPYVLQMFAGAEKFRDKGYFVLNRYYSCLGTPSQYLRNVMPVQFSKAQEARLRDMSPYTDKSGIWMYDDSTAPWESPENFRNYMGRLEVLASCTFFKGGDSGEYTPWYIEEEDCFHSGHTLPDPTHGLDRSFYKVGEKP